MGSKRKTEAVQITSMKYPDNGGMTLVAKHPAFLELAAESVKLFKESGGVNYVEWTMGTPDPDFGPFTIIIQRKNGKTPSERASEFKAALEEIRQLVHPKGDEPRLEGCAGCKADKALGSSETKSEQQT